MATPVTDRRFVSPGEVGHTVPVRTGPAYGRMNRAVFYVPRFTRHLRRRLKSEMPLSTAWRSARRRMVDYRD